jgi:hypothetical protein
MKNIKKVKENIMYYFALQNNKDINARCSLESDLAKLIFENLVMDGEQGNYRLSYYFSKNDLNAILEWFKFEFKIDYHKLLDINTALEKFTEKYNQNFRIFACEVLDFACQSFANEVIYQFFDAKFDNYYDEDDEDDEYYDPNERID